MSLILEEARGDAVARALAATRGNKSAAARLLGIDVRTIFRRCQRQP